MLGEYAQFVRQVRNNLRQEGVGRDEALRGAVRTCIQQGILKHFLETHRSEVENMLFDITEEEFLEIRAEEMAEERVEEKLEKRLAEITEEQLKMLTNERMEALVENRAEDLMEKKFDALLNDEELLMRTLLQRPQVVERCVRALKGAGMWNSQS